LSIIPDPTPISRADLPVYCLTDSARRRLSSEGIYICYLAINLRSIIVFLDKEDL
jgi:hypothetical protein